MPSTFRFDGFSSPNYTQIPDEFFDMLAPRLSEPELRVLLYIMRRILGFKKHTDDISLKQIVEGIRTRDGRILDHGAGVSKPTAIKGLRGLAEKGIISAVRNRSEERGDEATTYTLRFKGQEPVLTSFTGGVNGIDTGGVNGIDRPPVNDINTDRVNGVYPQETVVQERALQDTGVPSKTSKELTDLDKVITQVSKDFGDLSHVRSNRSRARNLAEQYGLDELLMAQLIKAAHDVVKPRQGELERPMAYFFETLEDRVKHTPGMRRSLAGKYWHVVRH